MPYVSDISDEELEENRRLNQIEHFPSRFRFLRKHKGLRPELLHALLALPGDGKSTLTRDIIWDTAKTAKVMVWLSEEKVRDYLDGYQQKIPPIIKSNLLIISETERVVSENQLETSFFEQIYTEKPKVVFFDNLTTSRLYEPKTPAGQFEFIMRIKEITQKEKIATFLVLHALKNVFDKQMLLDENRVRGSKGVLNLCEYFYCFQQEQIEDQIVCIFAIKKHRKHRIPVNERIYRVEYDISKNSYIEGYPINWEKIVEMSKQYKKQKEGK